MSVTIKKKYLPYSSAETQEILEHAEASLPKADSAIQPYSTETTTTGQTSTSETIGGKTIATSGDTKFILQPGQSITQHCEASSHATYIIGVNGSSKSILAETTGGDVSWTNETAEVVTVQVGCLSVGDTYTAKVTTTGLLDTVEGLETKIGAKYTKPVAGIPATDLKEDVQQILQGVATIDPKPTKDSDNPVSSGGVEAAIAPLEVTQAQFNAIFDIDSSDDSSDEPSGDSSD